MQRRVEARDDQGDGHDPGAAIGGPVRRRTQAPPEEREAGDQGLEVAAEVRGVEAGRVRGLLGPDLEEDAEVSQSGEGDFAGVLDGGADAGEGGHAGAEGGRAIRMGVSAQRPTTRQASRKRGCSRDNVPEQLQEANGYA